MLELFFRNLLTPELKQHVRNGQIVYVDFKTRSPQEDVHRERQTNGQVFLFLDIRNRFDASNHNEPNHGRDLCEIGRFELDSKVD